MSKRKSTSRVYTRKPPEERFWAKVKCGERDDCWLWQGSRHPNGYGSFGISRSTSVLAHRYAWEVSSKKKIPQGMCVLHRCDVRDCVNPSHLFLGTKKDNTQDMLRKGRHAYGDRHGSKTHPERVARGDRTGSRTHPEKRPRGENHGRAKLKDDDVQAIRLCKQQGQSTREIAQAYKISRQCVEDILSGRRWGHLNHPLYRDFGLPTG